jgi:putative peptidoglycan lipid II flippase
MVLNIFLNLILMQVWGHVGIALASSVAAWANAAALAVVLKRRGQLAIDDRLADRGPKIALASAGMTVGLFAGERLVVPACAGPCAANIPSLAVLIIGSMVLYGGLAHILGAARWSDLKALRWRGGEEVGGSLTTPK